MTNTDFSFLAGSWTSRQRRLVKVLAGCDEWYEFDATLDCQVYLDGNGTFDVLRAPERGIEGLTLRLYSPREKLWRIWWASAASGGRLDVPVAGRFDGTVGTFECDDTFENTPIRVRYRWSHVDTAQPRWEQAFSTDTFSSDTFSTDTGLGEVDRRWEVNWTATFSRRE